MNRFDQPHPTLTVLPSAQTPPDLLAYIQRVEADLDWGPPTDVVWSPPDTRVLVWLEGDLVAHAGIEQRVITVGGRELAVMGLSGVWSLPEHRGRGFARQAVLRAMAATAEQAPGVPLLLLARAHVVAFYEAVGWRVVPVPLVFDQPGGPYHWPAVTMVHTTDGAPWPNGDIDLRGLPW